MSDLVISTTDLLGSPQHARVVVSLVDADQRPVTYGTVSGDPVAAVVRKATDRDGLLTLDLVENGDISPENTYYLVQVGAGSWLIEKGEDSETVTEALVADPSPLAPALLAAHIADPTAAHAATAISWDGSQLGFDAEDVDAGIVELALAANNALEAHDIDPAAHAGVVRSDGTITSVVSLTQAAYDDLTPVSTTLYVIVG